MKYKHEKESQLLQSTSAFPSAEPGQEVLDGVVDDLDPTEDGEACEETHGAANKSQLALHGDLDVPLNLNKESDYA